MLSSLFSNNDFILLNDFRCSNDSNSEKIIFMRIFQNMSM